ncbi:MAG: response regulator transcription factor [Negativicutes bacterium]
MSKTKVMIVDDDSRIRDLLRLYLIKADFQVIEAEDGIAALLLHQQNKPDIILLDIMMPVLDGLETCRQIRKLDSTPIILLTARTEEEDKLMAFGSGADDYVEKPFNPSEVIARIRAILRRRPASGNVAPVLPTVPSITHGLLVIDPLSRTVKIDGADKELTVKEFDLLHTLAGHPGHVFTRESLLQTIWGIESSGDTRTVDIHIQRLRQKLEDGCCPQWKIATVWGIGYRFETSKEKENNP